MTITLTYRVKFADGEEVVNEMTKERHGYRTHEEARRAAIRWIKDQPGDLVAHDETRDEYFFAVKTSHRAMRRRSTVTVSTTD